MSDTLHGIATEHLKDGTSIMASLVEEGLDICEREGDRQCVCEGVVFVHSQPHSIFQTPKSVCVQLA